MANVITCDAFVAKLGGTAATTAAKFCFIIGSGCSVANGIPTGWHLADKWYQELPSIYTAEELDRWKVSVGIDEDDLGRFYSQVFGYRFAKDPPEGFRAINHEIEKGRTGFGHIILGQVLVKTGNNVVITTNFDTLIEETIYSFTEARPVICGHESVARYAKPSPERPLLLKIHRDRFMEPFNLDEQISALQPEWTAVFNEVFSSCIPIVIGYGGNDGSLMNYLLNAAPCQKMFWCTNTDRPLRGDITAVIDHHNGEIVRIEDFNRLMLRLAAVFKVGRVNQFVLQKAQHQADLYIKGLLQLAGNVSSSGTGDEKKSLRAVAADFDANDWWHWELMAVEASTPEDKINIYQRGLESLPGDKNLYYNLAYLLDELGMYAAALPYLEKAVEADTGFAAAWMNLGVTLRNLGQYERAISCYRKVTELETSNAAAWSNMGFCYHSKAEYLQAIKCYEKALAINNKKSNTWNNLGFTYKAMARLDEAVACFEKAAASEPLLAMPWFNLGNIFFETDKARAMACYEKALALDGEMADAWYNLGLLYLSLENKPEAKRCVGEAYRINPNAPAFKSQLDDIDI